MKRGEIRELNGYLYFVAVFGLENSYTYIIKECAGENYVLDPAHNSSFTKIGDCILCSHINNTGKHWQNSRLEAS